MFALCVSLLGMVARRSDVVSFARKFHEQPQAPGLVLYLTGGCMQLAPMLLTVPGASRTVLELQVPYSQRSLRELIETEPAQYVSADVARQLARQAFLRAQELSGTAAANDGTGGGRCLGLGCTAALRSDPVKRGEHRCFLALHSALGVWELELTLNKALNRSRALEDEVVSRCALVALAQVTLTLTLTLTPALALALALDLFLTRTRTRTLTLTLTRLLPTVPAVHVRQLQYCRRHRRLLRRHR